ncbi:unnamed protein product [Owenia fusiformis]|uniref:Uncharacterized protein n=1 Tax=Owenia fusiformis TaxID=6347 RepID=A0A8J1U9E7_OWEFU|nr:unnamed protein product [Owenia fusiformis]
MYKHRDNMDNQDYATEKTALLGSSGGKDQAERSNPRTKLTVAAILLCELCERLTYYSIVANMVLFATNVLGYSSVDAVTINLIFTGTVYFIPLFGGYIADSVAGRFNTIWGSGLIYIVGTLMLPLVAFDWQGTFGRDDNGLNYGLDQSAKRGYYIIGLILIAIGTGGIKANVSPFGVQQLEDMGPQAVQSFFNWFYWFINVGSAIAYAAVAYIQQNIAFDIGYLIPALSMVLATIIVLVPRNKYTHTAPEGSALARVIEIIWAALKRKKHSIMQHDSFLDYALESNGGRYSAIEIEGVKSLGRMIPVFLTLILYWTIYNQMQTTFLLQGERMDLRLGSFIFPAASLSLFNTIIIIILVPIVDRFFYPLLERCGRKITLLQRIGIGLLLAPCSVFVAGFLEIARKDELANSGGIEQNVGGKIYNASNLNIMLQVPQFVLVGTSEVFAAISAYEFAYSQAPVSLQGVVMGVNLATTGLGSYVGTLLVNIVNAASNGSWYPDELNTGNIENFLFLMSGLGVVNFLIFLPVAMRYRYARFSELQSETSGLDLRKSNGTIDNTSDLYSSLGQGSNEIRL